MKLSTLKNIIPNLQKLNFELPDGTLIPSHYHVTEVGIIHKNFIDCGGVIREEKVVNFQLWYSDDVDHSLQPQKLLSIIRLSEEKLGIEDSEIEVEYQASTIGKYGLDFNGNNLVLVAKQTACLAADKCMPAANKPKVNLNDLIANKNSCSPNSGCC
ncbi:DUF6428 family protein [Aureispira anguillae]|uniref:DUF6428 family protein n=1 Tax=Aureispira anguillae TaxID=2864201 RepID=A0A915YGF6_9BACT|nr:DUF6428 family protein [Aureispira anguillae]BDS12526.1 DUF6428 family protein [Aureispira anguillae]